MRARFHDSRSDERDGAGEDRNRNGDMSVGVSHIDLDSLNHAINHRADDTAKQPDGHAARRKQQRREEHTEDGGRNN